MRRRVVKAVVDIVKSLAKDKKWEKARKMSGKIAGNPVSGILVFPALEEAAFGFRPPPWMYKLIGKTDPEISGALNRNSEFENEIMQRTKRFPGRLFGSSVISAENNRIGIKALYKGIIPNSIIILDESSPDESRARILYEDKKTKNLYLVYSEYKSPQLITQFFPVEGRGAPGTGKGTLEISEVKDFSRDPKSTDLSSLGKFPLSYTMKREGFEIDGKKYGHSSETYDIIVDKIAKSSHQKWDVKSYYPSTNYPGRKKVIQNLEEKVRDKGIVISSIQGRSPLGLTTEILNAKNSESVYEIVSTPALGVQSVSIYSPTTSSLLFNKDFPKEEFMIRNQFQKYRDFTEDSKDYETPEMDKLSEFYETEEDYNPPLGDSSLVSRIFSRIEERDLPVKSTTPITDSLLKRISKENLEDDFAVVPLIAGAAKVGLKALKSIGKFAGGGIAADAAISSASSGRRPRPRKNFSVEGPLFKPKTIAGKIAKIALSPDVAIEVGRKIKKKRKSPSIEGDFGEEVLDEAGESFAAGGVLAALKGGAFKNKQPRKVVTRFKYDSSDFSVSRDDDRSDLQSQLIRRAGRLSKSPIGSLPMGLERKLRINASLNEEDERLIEFEEERLQRRKSKGSLGNEAPNVSLAGRKSRVVSGKQNFSRNQIDSTKSMVEAIQSIQGNGKKVPETFDKAMGDVFPNGYVIERRMDSSMMADGDQELYATYSGLKKEGKVVMRKRNKGTVTSVYEKDGKNFLVEEVKSVPQSVSIIIPAEEELPPTERNLKGLIK
jgi:hypothetical protein